MVTDINQKKFLSCYSFVVTVQTAVDFTKNIKNIKSFFAITIFFNSLHCFRGVIFIILSCDSFHGIKLLCLSSGPKYKVKMFHTAYLILVLQH